MKIAVVGAGAMGAIFGARFAQAGHETILVDTAQPLVDTYNRDGVRVLCGEDETTTVVTATTDPAAVGLVDIVVFFTKCYHTASAAEFARPLVGPATVVASLQNGWGNGEVIAETFPAEQLVVGVTYNSGMVLEPGRIAHPGVGPTTIGAYDGAGADAVGSLARVLQDGGLDATIADPVRPEIWKKLILNAATLPTAAIAGVNAGVLTTHLELRELVSETAREAVGVARMLGYDIDADDRVDYIHTLLERAGAARGSMLQDFEAGRRTEIDVINGAVVRAADAHGVPVPINRSLVALVKGWESAQGLA